MDINTLRGLLTLALLVCFTGICFWAYSKKQAAGFSEAANLPFADEPVALNATSKTPSEKNSGEPS
ncbi:MAG TPA: cbb3-type cytochrome c oxidase subunit 3 [Pseudomonadales bacterium]|nr:cbb3-type cytochrome c oxidase subunit 3 [Pseudomonadales bacterium]